MKAESQYLHSEMALNESAGTAVAALESYMKVPPRLPVTFRGSRLEKSSGSMFEAFFIGVFLLSFFLSACAPTMRAPGSESQSGQRVLDITGEATMPPATNILDEKSLVSVNGPDTLVAAKRPSALMSFVDQEAVSERVRLVTGWLKFVRQNKTAAIVESGWNRVQSRQIIEPLDDRAVPGRPELSTSELMLWRQVLKSQSTTNEVQDNRMETLATVLALAASPDDLATVDNLVEPEIIAVY